MLKAFFSYQIQINTQNQNMNVLSEKQKSFCLAILVFLFFYFLSFFCFRMVFLNIIYKYKLVSAILFHLKSSFCSRDIHF